MSLMCARLIDQNACRPPVEHGHEHGDVGQVVAAVIGVVEQEHVAGMDVAGEGLADRAGGEGQRADVHGHVLGLGDEAARGVADAGREIAAGIQDLRIGRAQHGLAHLLDDGVQAVLHDRDGDRVDGRRLRNAVVWIVNSCFR